MSRNQRPSVSKARRELGPRKHRGLGPAALAFASALSVSAAAQDPAFGHSVTISNDSFRVRVGRLGVLVGVPATGLRTVDGPRVLLFPGFAEWSGIYYTGPAGAVAAGANGVLPDWADRRQVRSVSFRGSPNRAVSVSRIDDLEVETEFRFAPAAPFLIVSTRLTNRGDSTLRRVFFTREWLQPGEPGWTFPDDLLAGVGPNVPNVGRMVWMFDDMPPGRSTGAVFSYAPAAGPAPDAPEVPLSLWTNASHPLGMVFTGTRGVALGDYDSDGWVDVFAAFSGRLWRNVQGSDWQFVADLDHQGVLAPSYRYSASFGDYDHDGFPDLPVEPRACCSSGPTCFQMLRNLGGVGFQQVAAHPPSVISSPCDIDAETICWGDVDGDGDQDLFLPAYPPWGGGLGMSGNFFWTNQGPAGGYRFIETTTASGLSNPPGSARPEGAQLCDVDFDGDLDLFSNGTLYQNRSTRGVPSFAAMLESASGIGLSTQLEEGARFFDYDMDGDYDLFAAYVLQGVMIWENRGDGTFFGESTAIQCPSIGSNLGMSAADWDNDGDIDFTTRQVFRRNQMVETGRRQFTVASHQIPAGRINSAIPAWCDWDLDGDLDCVLSNWGQSGTFYQNDTYDASTPPADRRFVRIRPVLDSTSVPGGLETEYGASVEIRVEDEEATSRRVAFTSSSAGYINQDEYALHFALPPDPAPSNPEEDLSFDVVADFVGLPSAGLHRVDGNINPALHGIALDRLTDREIRVFRSGRVQIGSSDVPPSPLEDPPLATSGSGLALATATTALPAPSPAPPGQWFVGLEFRASREVAAMRVAEIVLDGQLAQPVPSPFGPFNLALWDVSLPGFPALVRRATLVRETSPRNHRHRFATDWLLEGGHTYRLVARVRELRATPFSGPTRDGPMWTTGGLSFPDDSPGTGGNVAGASLDPTRLYLAVRARTVRPPQWINLGNGHGGAEGHPRLSGSPPLTAGAPFDVHLAGARPGAEVRLVAGLSLRCADLLGGSLLPEPELVLAGRTDAAGGWAYSGTWPKRTAPGTALFLQALIADDDAPRGWAFSNAIWATTRSP